MYGWPLRDSPRLSEFGYANREVVLLDKAVRPELFHQLVSAKRVAAVFNQHSEKGELFWLQPNGLPVAQQGVALLYRV